MDIPTATAVITAAIAALVGFITLRQWLTDRARLKHELFDRRYQIYETIAAFPADILVAGSVQPGADIQFLRDTKLAYFAFGCDDAVKRVVDQLYKLAVDLHATQAEFPGLTGTDRTANLDRQVQIKGDLSHISQSLPSIFTKYLKLGH
jgi:predicted nucleotidyltransferase